METTISYMVGVISLSMDHEQILQQFRLLAMLPLTSIAMSATLAPKVAIYTSLACAQHKPEIASNSTRSIPFFVSHTDNFSYTVFKDTELPGTIKIPSDLCKSDPVVQAAVAKLAGGMYHKSTSCLQC